MVADAQLNPVYAKGGHAAATYLVDHLAEDSAVDQRVTARLLENFADFDRFVKKAESNLAEGDVEAAIFWGTIASHVPPKRHAGIFWSPRLERLIRAVALRIGPAAPFHPAPPSADAHYRKILHVATQVVEVGGLTRMLARWINADLGRRNSVVLTQQRGSVPEFFRETVQSHGGTIKLLNHQPGGILEWARILRDHSREFDAVVLHIHCEDMIPLLAFADPALCPPVFLLNHADHLFWLGSSEAHLTFNLRESAADLCISRRGIPPERSFLLPTLVEHKTRNRSREAAKRAIGESPETVLLVSIARGAKYKTMNGVSYADFHVETLQRHPHAKLIVVGPGDPADWEEAKAATGGRIVSLAETPDPTVYYEAADIYLDSYPFTSSTSMMEAACYSCPLVTIFVPPARARIMAINHVGLGQQLTARNYEEYCRLLSELIDDAALRARLGAAVRAEAERFILPPRWTDILNEGYRAAARLPRLDNADWLAQVPTETPSIGEPDRRHEEIYGDRKFKPEDAMRLYMGMVRMRIRISAWWYLVTANSFSSVFDAACSLFPTWILRRIKS